MYIALTILICFWTDRRYYQTLDDVVKTWQFPAMGEIQEMNEVILTIRVRLVTSIDKVYKHRILSMRQLA